MKEGFDADKTLDAMWVKDSETCEEWLMDRNTNKPVAKRVDGVIYPTGRE